MKIIGWLLVIGILLSYAPCFTWMDALRKITREYEDGCGVPFHCPMIVDIVVSEISRLPFNGLLIAPRILLPSDGLLNPVFHPPEYLNPNFTPRDEREE